MKISGKIWKYGDDVNTDVIFAGKYTYKPMEPAEMATHAMEDLDPTFAKEVRKGDIVVAGWNFGCGSSREQAADCIAATGVAAVVARSFSRIFFRNAINVGLPVVELPDGPETMNKNDIVEIDFDAGIVLHNGVKYTFPALPPEIKGILDAGGLIQYTKKRLASEINK